MKIELLLNQRVVFEKGTILEVSEGEANRLCSLGFAKNVQEAVKKPVETPAETVVEKPKTKRSKK